MNILTQIAKMAVENYIKEGKIIDVPKNVPERFKKEKAGTFVTIEKKLPNSKEKELRGCIGTYLPTKENIAKEIISNAISAATKDFRFGEIKKEELPYLSYTVYILSKPQKVLSLEELNPKKYGIIVKSGFKTGLLLPDLKGINTKEEQIFYACQKAGIDPQKEVVEIYKFSAEKY
jgi:AmmeMemoRadiSam system protein A